MKNYFSFVVWPIFFAITLFFKWIISVITIKKLWFCTTANAFFLLGFAGVYHWSIPYSGLLCRQTWLTKFPRNSTWNSRTSRIYFNTDIYTSVHVWIYHCIHDSYRRSARKRYVNKGPYWSLWMQTISLTCCGISKFITLTWLCRLPS